MAQVTKGHDAAQPSAFARVAQRRIPRPLQGAFALHAPDGRLEGEHRAPHRAGQVDLLTVAQENNAQLVDKAP